MSERDTDDAIERFGRDHRRRYRRGILSLAAALALIGVGLVLAGRYSVTDWGHFFGFAVTGVIAVAAAAWLVVRAFAPARRR